MTGSSIQNVSSTSIDGRVVSCNIASAVSSTPPAICLGVLFPFEVLTSTAMSVIPRECSRVSHSKNLALDLVLEIFDAFMPLGAIRCFVSVCVLQKSQGCVVSTSLSAAFTNWVFPRRLPAAAHAAACGFDRPNRQPLTPVWQA
jgi:hypothetical protein